MAKTKSKNSKKNRQRRPKPTGPRRFAGPANVVSTAANPRRGPIAYNNVRGGATGAGPYRRSDVITISEDDIGDGAWLYIPVAPDSEFSPRLAYDSHAWGQYCLSNCTATWQPSASFTGRGTAWFAFADVDNVPKSVGAIQLAWGCVTGSVYSQGMTARMLDPPAPVWLRTRQRDDKETRRFEMRQYLVAHFENSHEVSGSIRFDYTINWRLPMIRDDMVHLSGFRKTRLAATGITGTSDAYVLKGSTFTVRPMYVAEAITATAMSSLTPFDPVAGVDLQKATAAGGPCVTKVGEYSFDTLMFLKKSESGHVQHYVHGLNFALLDFDTLTAIEASEVPRIVESTTIGCNGAKTAGDAALYQGAIRASVQFTYTRKAWRSHPNGIVIAPYTRQTQDATEPRSWADSWAYTHEWADCHLEYLPLATSTINDVHHLNEAANYVDGEIPAGDALMASPLVADKSFGTVHVVNHLEDPYAGEAENDTEPIWNKPMPEDALKVATRTLNDGLNDTLAPLMASIETNTRVLTMLMDKLSKA